MHGLPMSEAFGQPPRGAPAARSQRMALSVTRGPVGGRSVRARSRGISGLIASHSSSLISCRFISTDLSVVTESYCRFAALNVLDGTIISQCQPRHRHQEWLRFLKLIDSQIPIDKAVHLICD